MSRRFEEQVAWITGGGTGIGKALALELAARGARVVVSGRRADRLAEAVREIEALGAQATAIACDVTSEGSIATALEQVLHHFGQLDVAVANAGFSVSGRVESLSADDWRRQLDTNVVGLAVTAKHALGELRKTRGRLVLMGSVAGFIASPGTAAYAASKAAVAAIGRTLSMELHGSGVSCTTIHPGFVASEIAQVNNQGRYDARRRDPRPKLLMWQADRAARVCADAIHARRRELVFTGHGRLGVWVGRHAPALAHAAMVHGLAPRRGTQP